MLRRDGHVVHERSQGCRKAGRNSRVGRPSQCDALQERCKIRLVGYHARAARKDGGLSQAVSQSLDLSSGATAREAK